MALLGMASNLAEAGSCTITTPPFSLMAFRPSVPSLPMPERMTPTPNSRWSSARERKKKSIGSRSPRGADGLEQVQLPVEDGHVLVRGNHVDAARPDRHAVLHLHDLHGGGPLQQLGHHPLERGVQVLDDDERQPAVRLHVAEKLGQRLQSPRRRRRRPRWQTGGAPAAAEAAATGRLLGRPASCSPRVGSVLHGSLSQPPLSVRTGPKTGYPRKPSGCRARRSETAPHRVFTPCSALRVTGFGTRAPDTR